MNFQKEFNQAVEACDVTKMINLYQEGCNTYENAIEILKLNCNDDFSIIILNTHQIKQTHLNELVSLYASLFDCDTVELFINYGGDPNEALQPFIQDRYVNFVKYLVSKANNNISDFNRNFAYRMYKENYKTEIYDDLLLTSGDEYKEINEIVNFSEKDINRIINYIHFLRSEEGEEEACDFECGDINMAICDTIGIVSDEHHDRLVDIIIERGVL